MSDVFLIAIFTSLVSTNPLYNFNTNSIHGYSTDTYKMVIKATRNVVVLRLSLFIPIPLVSEAVAGTSSSRTVKTINTTPLTNDRPLPSFNGVELMVIDNVLPAIMWEPENRLSTLIITARMYNADVFFFGAKPFFQQKR